MDKFIFASNLLGCRFDLIQAGGGNTSVKIGDQLFVKSSGLSVADIRPDSGYSKLCLTTLRNGLFAQDRFLFKKKNKQELEYYGKKLLESSELSGHRASIETFIHACFKKYTFHTHPISVNCYVSNEEKWNELKKLFPEAYFADYATPGIELFLSMAEFIEEAERSESATVVFLKNHGLIVSSNNYDEALKITSDISISLERRLGLALHDFRVAADLFELIHQNFGESIPINPVLDDSLNQKILFNQHFSVAHFSPDVLIYLGHSFLQLKALHKGDLEDYIKKYNTLPTILIFSDRTYIRASTYKKIKETEDMLRFYFYVTSSLDKEKLLCLSKSEVSYLSGWEAEKYRQGTI